MSRRLAMRVLLLAIAVAGGSATAQQAERAAAVRFAAIDVYLDSPAPLAAWQFELGEANGQMTVVGVESGDSGAFAGTPYYDLDTVRAGAADRVIVADFSLETGSNLPVGRFRAATIHVQLSGPAEPNYELRLVAAGDADGNPIDAGIELAR